MIVDYKIKFDKDGLTITQRIQSGGAASVPAVKSDAPVIQKLLPATFQQVTTSSDGPPGSGGGGGSDEKDTGGKKKGGGADEKDPGGGDDTLNSGMATFIGPFIFLCPPEGMYLPSPAPSPTPAPTPEVKNAE